MARAQNAPKPPEGAAESAAPPVVDSAVQAPPAPPAPLDPPVDEKTTAKYVAKWSLHGFPCGPLEAGDTVELTEEQAAPLVECGVLSLVKGED